VESALPVGSRTVARRIDLGLSPATIRNTMMDLEEQGLLGHPHTSAGRIPTDLGYRAYVDDLMEPEPMTAAEESWIGEQLASGPRDLASLLEQAARLLGTASHQLGLVLGPAFSRGILTGLEFVRVSGQRVLVILRVRDGLVRTVLIELATQLDPDALARVAQSLNEYLVGLTLEEICATLAERARSWSFRDEEIVTRIVDLGPQLFGLGESSVLYVGGTKNIVSQPEFQAPDRIRQILEVLEDRPSLSTLMEERLGHGGVHITIGRENPAGPLRSTSIVTCVYPAGALCGAIGVIGPTRMPYRRVVGILQQVVGQIGRHLSS
jgi:heat-inducible transcriptional repressor